MAWVFLAICLGGALVAVTSYRLNGCNLIAPSLVFLGIWVTPWTLSLLRLSTLQGEYSAQGLATTGLVTLLMLTVMLGCELVASGTSRLSEGVPALHQSVRWIAWDRPRVAFTLAGAMLLVVAGIYWVEFRPIGFPLFGIRPEVIEMLAGHVHRFGKDSKLQLILTSDAMLGAVACMGLLAVRRWRWKLLYGLLMLLPLATGLLKLSKYDLLQPLMFYGIVYYFWHWGRGRRWRRIALVGTVAAVVVVGFGVATNYRIKLLGSQQTYGETIGMRPLTGMAMIDEGVAFYYGYASLNFYNFDRVLTTRPMYELGLSMFRPVYTLTLSSEQMDQVQGRIEPKRVSGASAVGTFMRDLYFEGGLPVVYAGAGIYAALVGVAYVLFRRRMNAYRLLLYAGLMWPLLWMFFQNNFSNLDLYASVGIGMAMVWGLRRLSGPRVAMEGGDG